MTQAAQQMDARTPSSLSQVAGQARAWRSQLMGQLFAAGKPGTAIDAALLRLADACDAIIAAQGRAARLIADPQYAAAHKLEQVKKLMSEPVSDALRSVIDLKNAMDAARDKYAGAIATDKPSATEAALLPFHAGELARTLEAAGKDAGKVAVTLLRNALAADNRVQAYLLTSGELRLTFERCGCNLPWLFQQFSQVLDEAGVVSVAPGASLYPYISQGGAGTLNGFVDGARMSINKHQQAYNAWLVNAARHGVLAGLPDTGASSTIR